MPPSTLNSSFNIQDLFSHQTISSPSSVILSSTGNDANASLLTQQLVLPSITSMPETSLQHHHMSQTDSMNMLNDLNGESSEYSQLESASHSMDVSRLLTSLSNNNNPNDSIISTQEDMNAFMTFLFNQTSKSGRDIPPSLFNTPFPNITDPSPSPNTSSNNMLFPDISLPFSDINIPTQTPTPTTSKPTKPLRQSTTSKKKALSNNGSSAGKRRKERAQPKPTPMPSEQHVTTASKESATSASGGPTVPVESAGQPASPSTTLSSGPTKGAKSRTATTKKASTRGVGGGGDLASESAKGPLGSVEMVEMVQSILEHQRRVDEGAGTGVSVNVKSGEGQDGVGVGVGKENGGVEEEENDVPIVVVDGKYRCPLCNKLFSR
jgi:hypothetical protein